MEQDAYIELLFDHLTRARGEGFRLLFSEIAREDAERVQNVLDWVAEHGPEKLANLRVSDLAQIEIARGDGIRPRGWAKEEVLEAAAPHVLDEPEDGPVFGPPDTFPELFRACFDRSPALAWLMLEAATPAERHALAPEDIAPYLTDREHERREAALRYLAETKGGVEVSEDRCARR